MACLSATFWRKWPDRAVPSVLISTVVSFCIVWIAISILILFDVVPNYSVISYIEFVRSWIFVVGFEFCLVVFVWPVYQHRLNPAAPTIAPTDAPRLASAPPTPELRSTDHYLVQIGDLVVDTRMLQTIQAQEHHVEITCINRTDMTRLSISKAAAVLGEVDGMLIHRSWWVARRAAKHLNVTMENWCWN